MDGFERIKVLDTPLHYCIFAQLLHATFPARPDNFEY